MSQSKSAVFLDLQGTLGGSGVDDISTFVFYPFSATAIKELNKRGIPAIVLTNQSNIARGIITQCEFDDKIDALKKELACDGAFLDGVYCCPHVREDNCSCKKPLTGLIDKASIEHCIYPNASYVVGDMGMNDIVLARNVGAKGILVLTGAGQGSMSEYRHTWKDYEADYIAANVHDAICWILRDSIGHL